MGLSGPIIFLVVSFGLRVFESIAILRSEFARGMVQPGWRSERLG